MKHSLGMVKNIGHRLDYKPGLWLFIAFLLFVTAKNSQASGLFQNASQKAHGSSYSEGIVAYCFDGDTIKLADRRIVRLAGIDAPEMAHENRKAQYYARTSKNELVKFCLGKRVRLYGAGISSRDRYGRLVAEVYLENGKSLNELMLASGAAFFYPHQDLSPTFQEKLREIQQNAIRDRQGMWKHLLSLPIARKNYLGNRSSLRFFPMNCQEAQSIKPRNRVHFGTLMDAFLAGYAPARICPFWPEEN